MSNPNADKLSYEEMSSFAASNDAAVRKTIAERKDVIPEILYYLANDSEPNVRLSVALNPNSPPQIFSLLANDKDEIVRKGLASKFSLLAPDIDEENLSQMWKVTHGALEKLARDQIVKVRQALAEALKGFVTAPQDIIESLSRDLETIVSAPVLEFSPVLRDEDLLDIINQGTVSTNLVAISRRKIVSEPLSDAIVEADDMHAIAELLANDSAQIREEVLDTLIDRAHDFEFWHAPLVARPFLPRGAPQRLAQFISDNLIENLKKRIDLDDEALQEISNIMRERFGEDYSDDDIHLTGTNVFEFLTMPLPMVRVERLVATGSLKENEIMRAIKEGDYLFVLAALVALSEFDEIVVKRIFKEQNAKAIVALVWKAGLMPDKIVDIQHRVARLAPNNVINPKPLPDPEDVNYLMLSLEFPLSEKEMEWSLQFYISLVDRETK